VSIYLCIGRIVLSLTNLLAVTGETGTFLDRLVFPTKTTMQQKLTDSIYPMHACNCIFRVKRDHREITELFIAYDTTDNVRILYNKWVLTRVSLLYITLNPFS
jgi:hypothetical protein